MHIYIYIYIYIYMNQCGQNQLSKTFLKVFERKKKEGKKEGEKKRHTQGKQCSQVEAAHVP